MVANSKSEMEVKWIPFDIMAASMLHRLPVKSLARFRCVCKQWCSLTHDPDFIMKHLKKALKTTESLTFFCRDTNPSENIPLHSFIQINSNDEVRDNPIYINYGDTAFYTSSNSVNGLICVFRYSNESSGYSCLSLVNPTTRQSLELPKLKNVDTPWLHERTMESLVLGYDDTTGVYKVVRSRNVGSSLRLDILTVGTQEWRVVGDIPFLVFLQRVVFLNGALHWLVIKYDPVPLVKLILAFDIKDERFRFMSLPGSLAHFGPISHGSADPVNISQICIRKIEGHICVVQKSKHSTRLPSAATHPPTLIIWKLKNYTEHGWKKEYDISPSSWVDEKEIVRLGDHVIGLTNGKLLIQMRNTIYSYDIYSGTFSTLFSRSYVRQVEGFTESLVSPSSAAIPVE